MDKIDAIKLATSYLWRIKNNDIRFSEAWLFGSYAKGNQHDNSDIDIAIVLDDREKKTFEIEVKLMILRTGEEIIIEPHAFTKNEFNDNLLIIDQIIKSGERLKI